jgi:N-acetylneuraminic acid mutarotase
MLRAASSFIRRGLVPGIMVALLAPVARGAAGSWNATGSLAVARGQHTATLLGNGKVLVAGGDNGGSLGSAELYDTTAGTWSATGSLVTARKRHTATLLTNGRVLVVGGFGPISDLATAEFYDPTTGTWSATGSITTAREQHTATLLANGKVLVAGGYNGGVLASPQLYDPVLGTWSSAGSFPNARYQHTATLLPNGKVLVAGGLGGGGPLTSVVLYDPIANAWSITGALNTERDQHTATLLPDGKVLVAGGFGLGGALSSAEVYDPASGTWSATGFLVVARDQHTATLLLDGTVLVAGGVNGGALGSAEIYPSGGIWNVTGSLVAARTHHSATLLPSGKVLAAGGENGGALSSAEIFDPNDIVPPTVQVLAPNGGQVDNITTITIEWTASDNAGVDHVDIYFSTNGGSSFGLLAAGQVNDGSYDWDGAPLTSQGRVRIVAFDAAGNSATDDSDEDVTVINSPPPAIPSPFTGVFLGGPVQLHWGANTEPDFAFYHLHRGDSAEFVPAPGNLVVSQADTGYVDSGSTWSFYKLSALDVLGNESGFALLTPSASAQGVTPTGSNVTVPITPSVQVTFPDVSSGGLTELTMQTGGTVPPNGLKLAPSAPKLYYVLSSTATFTGEVTVCITYNPANVSGQESNLKMMHYDTDRQPPSWVEVTASVDEVNNVICGTVAHFSEFALMETDPTVDVGEGIPSTVQLYSCAPNPVSGAARIVYDLPVTSSVRLALFDLQGRWVRDLDRQPAMGAGRHAVQWDGRGAHGERLRAGVYFLWLEAGGARQMRRVAVTR